jgi:hypothetical protein
MIDPVARLPRSPVVRMRLLVVAVVGLAACGGGAAPTPTGAICPPGSTLTYENFAAGFMEQYCTRCHHSELSGADRNGAPIFHDFDTRVGILNVGGHVDEWAAAGPNAINKMMPDDDGAAPTEPERFQLGEWLACEEAALGRPDARLPDAAPVDAASPDASPDAQ